MPYFDRLVTAAESSLGWPTGSFLEAHLSNRAEAVQITVEGDPLATAICDFASKEGWHGSAEELLTVLNQRATDDTKRRKAWPKAANGLSGRLRRIAPSLTTTGFEVKELDRRTSDRRKEWSIKIVHIVRTVQTQTTPSAELNDVNDPNDVSATILDNDRERFAI